MEFNKVKIAFLFGSLNRGGLETLLLDVCQNLKKTDFEAIGIYRKGGVLEQDFINSGIDFIKILTGKKPLKYLWNLRKTIIENKITIIHAQQPIDALYAKIACLETNVKVILTLHGFDFSGESNVLKYIIKKTHQNIFVSDYQRNYYTNKFKLNQLNQTVVYNGINFDKFKIRSEKVEALNNLRNELKIDNSISLMGMVGNFNEGRDQITICRFLKLLNEKSVDFHFVFVGKRIETSPERFDDCVQFCDDNSLNDNVSFLGVRSDVPEILPQLDAFIYSTEHDTFGIAVVEAIASGIPVFVNDWDVMNEITEHGNLATTYKTKDENDLLEKFMLFLQDKENYIQKAKENAERVREKYSIENHIERLKEVYQKIV